MYLEQQVVKQILQFNQQNPPYSTKKTREQIPRFLWRLLAELLDLAKYVVDLLAAVFLEVITPTQGDDNQRNRQHYNGPIEREIRGIKHRPDHNHTERNSQNQLVASDHLTVAAHPFGGLGHTLGGKMGNIERAVLAKRKDKFEQSHQQHQHTKAPRCKAHIVIADQKDDTDHRSCNEAQAEAMMIPSFNRVEFTLHRGLQQVVGYDTLLLEFLVEQTELTLQFLKFGKIHYLLIHNTKLLFV